MTALLIGYARFSSAEQDRSLPDARAIADELTTRRVRLASAAPSTTPPTPSDAFCSTFWPWSPNLRPTSSDCGPGRV
jgi:hypothetical protein